MENLYDDQAETNPSEADYEYEPLGQSIHNPRVIPQPGCNNDYICFTLSAYPLLKVTRNNYFSDLTPSDQKTYYYCLLKDMFRRYKDRMGFTLMTVHYELNKKGMLHVHGYVDIRSSIYGYKINTEELSGYCHKRIGKKGNYRKIAARFEYPIEGITRYQEYCNKENVFKPSKIRSPKITDYISCL